MASSPTREASEPFAAYSLCRDSKLHLVLLDGISNILTTGKKIGQLESARNDVETCGGLDKIERLQASPNEEVYRAALDLIEKFFSDEGDEDENVAPETHVTGAFTFSAPANVRIEF